MKSEEIIDVFNLMEGSDLVKLLQNNFNHNIYEYYIFSNHRY